MSLACIAAGADGLLVEVHENPDQALSDKEQAMNLTDFKDLFEKSHRLAQFMRDLKA